MSKHRGGREGVKMTGMFSYMQCEWAIVLSTWCETTNRILKMNSAHHTAGLLLHYTLFIVCVYHLHINQSWFRCWSLFLVTALIVLSVSDSCLKYNFKHEHQYSPSVCVSRKCYCTISWFWGVMTNHQRYFIFCVASKCIGVIFAEWIHFFIH